MNELKSSQQQLYLAINNLVESRLIGLKQFWWSDRICVPLQSFIQMVSDMGVKVSSELVERLQKDQVDLVNLQNLIENVEYWKSKQKNIATYLSKNSPIKRQKTDYESVSNSQVTNSNANSKSSMATTKKFLNDHTKKKLQDQIKLNMTLKNVKNQSNYGLTLKIGELNDICAKLKNQTNFSLMTKSDGSVCILASLRGKPEKQISEKKFETQYEQLKQKFMSYRDEIEEENLEEDLKKVLVEVMCLSSEMKKQIKLLERKGISH